MQVGQHIRIVQNYVSEDFVIRGINAADVTAASVLDKNRMIPLKLMNQELTILGVPDVFVYIVSALIGVPNLDVLCLAKVDDAALTMLSDADPDIQTLYRLDELWHAKLEYAFGDEVAQFKPQDVSAREFYEVYRDMKRIGADAVLLAGVKNGKVNAVKITLLLLAAAQNNPELLKAVNKAVILAAEKGNLEIVKDLLRAGANVNAADRDDKTILILASENGHLDVVKELLAAGASVNATNYAGWTVLMYAAANGHAEVVKELIQHGANVNAIQREGGTALISASRQGNLEIVRELIQHAANVNAADRNGTTSLMEAALNGHLGVVQELLRAGANVNTASRFDEETALIFAAQDGHLDVVKELIQHGADVNHKTTLGVTAWTAAIYGDHQAIADLLRAHGAK